MKKILLFFLLSLSLISNAQNPGDIAQSFGEFPGFNSPVYAIATQADGKILVGGYFTMYKGNTENYIIRLNTDGTRDTTFNAGIGFDNSVSTIAIQADGKILVGGYFTMYKGNTENHIIRLNTDGTKDTSFNSGTGFENPVSTIAIQTDGKILIGGDFNMYNGVINQKRIIRLNTDGAKDTSFNTGTGFDNSVSKIVTQTDGKILVGGDFTTYNGGTQNRIIRLNTDGTKDTSFNAGTGFNGIPNAITTQADGKILVGGSFTSYNGGTATCIIRLNTNGTKDTSFNAGTGLNYTVWAIAVQTDGKILVGGDFTTYNGGNENQIIRLNIDGTKDNSFTTGTGFNTLTGIKTIATQADGKILLGGDFKSYSGIGQNYIIRLNTNGTKDTSFTIGTGFNDSVRKIATQADGKILVGGDFTTYNEGTENRIIRFNNNGTKDSSFNTGSGFNNTIYAMAIQADGKVLLGGNFTTYKGSSENYIIRLNSDGTKDTSFTTGSGFNSSVLAIVTQTDGKILVGGSFTSYNGGTENYIIRLNPDGTKDTSFTTGTGFNTGINAIATQADGKILVGGFFSSYNGGTAACIIRLNPDGTKDSSFNSGTGFNSLVWTIATQTDGKILVGGAFTTYNGVTENRIIRLNTDGSKDTSFTTGTGFTNTVYTITTQADGKLLVGGGFYTYNSITENRIIRLNSNGTKDTSFITGVGFRNNIYTIVPEANGKLFLGGSFTTYKGDNSSASLIALHTETSLSTEDYSSTNVFSLYPNPVHDILHFQSNAFTNIKAVKIYDLQGKLVLETTNNNININNLTSGLYLAKVKTAKGEETKKFIKE